MTIAEALRAVAHHVEQHAAALLPDGSEDDRARLAEVSSLGHELDSLAAASETARVYWREYETFRDELQQRGFTLAPEVDQAVADAFEAERLAHHVPPPRRSAAPRAEASQP